ncbi:hypothetical protein MHM95_18140 [Pseudoalteromonas sp. CnMc7-15]|uniref:hypothetical protein n=1 Tax=unclassified Pseudoalteromonas TaxID=194690 RepID=UPI001EF72265|nr:hypothetical protein [Pseudoalteromonas sp. CnMc7-15]MCG7568195.1 hypothetical protein [Pseudoalteromonas sp. CnMc7-15]
MVQGKDIDPVEILAEELKDDLMQLYGPMIYGKALYMSLGYGSGDAFRQAVSRKSVPVPVFPIENRRGKFALTKDVALWIAKQRLDLREETKEEHMS